MKHILALAALCMAACTPADGKQQSDVAPQNVPITEQWMQARITTRPVDLDPAHPGPRRIGKLIFRGGVEITADVPEIGGLSGLYVDGNGRFLAVSDHASWVEATLVSDPNTAAPVRFENARVAGLRDEHAERFYETGLGDAEGLGRLPDGRFIVSFERTQLVRYYDLDRRGPFAPSTLGPPLAGADRLTANSGLEAVTYAGDDELLVGAEPDGALWRPRTRASDPAPIVARVSTPFGYGFVALDRLPDGNFVALQRFYAPVVGVRIRVLRIDARNLSAEPELLAELRPPLTLDNFEGLAAIRTIDGGARLFMVSDNNFSPTQRTLLYVFDLPPEPAPRP